MNRRDFLKFLGGAAAAVAVAPQALAEAFESPGLQGVVGPEGCSGPPGNLAPGFIVLEPGMSLQEAIDALPKEGGTVYIQSGTHIVDQEILMPQGVQMVAEGSLTISGCIFKAEPKPRNDAPIVFLMEEDDQVEIIGNIFHCEPLKQGWFDVPIGDHLVSLKGKMQRLYLKAKQLVT